MQALKSIRKKVTLMDSRRETKLYEQLRQIFPKKSSYSIQVQQQVRSLVSDFDWPRSSEPEKWSLMQSIDFVICKDGHDLQPLFGIQMDGVSQLESLGGKVYAAYQDDRTIRRKEKFQRQLNLLANISFPVLILPGYTNLSDPQVLIARLIALIDNECRRIDPSNPEWDRLIREISGNPIESNYLPDWSKLVKAEQLSIDF